MRRWNQRPVCGSTTALALALACTCAFAQSSRVDVGFLTCNLTQVGEAQGADPLPKEGQGDLNCSFKRAGGGPEETYVGTLQAISVGQQLSSERAFIWVVKAAFAAEPAPGFLQQSYVAEGIDPAQGSIPLVGETNRFISLHSLTEGEPQVQEGKERAQAPPAVIIGVTLNLKSAPG